MLQQVGKAQLHSPVGAGTAEVHGVVLRTVLTVPPSTLNGLHATQVALSENYMQTLTKKKKKS